MNDFKEGLKYNPEKRNIKSKPRSTRKRYTAKEIMRNRIIALALAGGIALGIGTSAKNIYENTQEQKYVSSITEVQECNLNARDLDILPDTYEEAMEFIENIQEMDLSNLTNDELSTYFYNMGNIQLNLLKEKVSNLTGRNTSDFMLIAPSIDGGVKSGTRVCERTEWGTEGSCIENINSKDVDQYMKDILNAWECSESLIKGDVDRNKLENNFQNMAQQLEGAMTIKLIRDEKGISSYRLENNRNPMQELNVEEQENEK